MTGATSEVRVCSSTQTEYTMDVNMAGRRRACSTRGRRRRPGGRAGLLVLLHGGLTTIETFGGLESYAGPALPRVYLPERRGHGRTPDVEGPITYEIMAQDTIAFMAAVGLPSAHVVGWSDGAVVDSW